MDYDWLNFDVIGAGNLEEYFCDPVGDVAFDLLDLFVGMFYLQMEQWHFDKNATLGVTKRLIGSTIGGIIVAGIASILAWIDQEELIVIYDIIVIAWGLVELRMLFESYLNLIANGGDKSV